MLLYTALASIATQLFAPGFLPNWWIFLAWLVLGCWVATTSILGLIGFYLAIGNWLNERPALRWLGGKLDAALSWPANKAEALIPSTMALLRQWLI